MRSEWPGVPPAIRNSRGTQDRPRRPIAKLPRLAAAAIAKEQDQKDPEDDRAGRMSNDVDENRLVEIGHTDTSLQIRCSGPI